MLILSALYRLQFFSAVHALLVLQGWLSEEALDRAMEKYDVDKSGACAIWYCLSQATASCLPGVLALLELLLLTAAAALH
jgi:hypothetical protein